MMKKDLAEKIWETWMVHPTMTIQPKGKESLKPAGRIVNFLGSVKFHKQRFLTAMEEFEEKGVMSKL